MDELKDKCLFNHIVERANPEYPQVDSGLELYPQTIQDIPHHKTLIDDSLKNVFAEAPEINEDRILYFKAEIKSGKYEINHAAIALNMLT